MWGGRPTGRDFLAYFLILISFNVADLIDVDNKAPIEKRDADDHLSNIQLNLSKDEENVNLVKTVNKRETGNEQILSEADSNPRNPVRRSLEEWYDSPQLSREAWEGGSYPRGGNGPYQGHRKIPAADIINPRGQIQCGFPGEMFYFWEYEVTCAICVCLISSEGVKPVCVACRTCIPGQPIIPTLPTWPTPIHTVETQPPPSWSPTYPPWTPEPTTLEPYWPTTPEPYWPTTPEPYWPTTTPEPWTPPTWPPTPHWTTTEVPWSPTWWTQRTLPTEPTTEPPYYPPVHHKSCRPLPENTQFINPMNPCQRCICNIVKDTAGQDVVSITCEEIPDCNPEPHTTLAPPDACRNMPTNVWFPHPYYYDEICICTMTEDMRTHIENIRIMCVKIPDHPTSRPYHTPPTVQTSTDYKHEIQTHSTTEYTPWTPEPTWSPTWQTTPSKWPTYIPPTPKPTPRPVFPPNHKSCKPYKPNVPFDHPWDYCQKCVCREFADQNSIYVEVDCYTKQECCIEIPLGDTTERYQIDHWPKKNEPIDIAIPDQLCQGKPVGAVFPFPGDSCYSCVCYLDGPSVYPACKRKQTQACVRGQGNLHLIPGEISYSHSEAHAQANSESWQSQAQAQANAVANGGLNNNANKPHWYQPNHHHYKPPRNVVIESEADASASANVQNINSWYQGGSVANSNANAKVIENQWGRPNHHHQGHHGPPHLIRPVGVASNAEAEAHSNAYNYPGSPYGNRPDASGSSAEAEVHSNSYNYPGSPYGNRPGASGSSAEAGAQSHVYNYPGSPYGYRPGAVGSNAGAEAHGNAISYPGSLFGNRPGASGSSAEAGAQSHVYNYPGSPYGYRPGAAGSSAEADAHSATFVVGQHGPHSGRLHSRDIANAKAHSDASGGYANADAKAEAESIKSRYPGLGGYSQDVAHADAHANANNQAYGNQRPHHHSPRERPHPRPVNYANGNSEALANLAGASAEASAEAYSAQMNVLKRDQKRHQPSHHHNQHRPGQYGAPWGSGNSAAHASASAEAYNNQYVRALDDNEPSVFQDQLSSESK